MEFTEYIRKPFKIQAIEITEENIEEVAQYVGTIRVKDGEKYISLDRRIVPNVPRANVGWFLTMLDDQARCYKPDLFHEQFIVHSPGSGYFFEEEDETDPVPIPPPMTTQRPSLSDVV